MPIVRVRSWVERWQTLLQYRAGARETHEIHLPFGLLQSAQNKRIFAGAAFVIFRREAGHGFVRL